jgi:hypothetical protein
VFPSDILSKLLKGFFNLKDILSFVLNLHLSGVRINSFCCISDRYHLLHAKILYESGLGVEGPIQGAYSALAVAGVDPVDQFLIRELVSISLSMVNISTIDFTMP